MTKKEAQMSVNLETYKEMLAQPWGKIMYELIFAQ